MTVSIFDSALSALRTSQTALRTTAGNIANVNTEGYNRRVVETSPLSRGGHVAGVTVEEVRRIADSFLAVQRLSSESRAAEAGAIARVHERIQRGFGAFDSEAALTGMIDSVFASLQTLANDPGSAARKLASVGELTQTLDALQTFAASIQTMRTEVDREFSGAIDRANQLIDTIHKLNPLIQGETLRGNTASALIDQREAALTELAQLMDIRTTSVGDGRLFVATGDGQSLVSEFTSRLTYDAPSDAAPATRYPGLMIERIHPASGAMVGSPTAIDGNIASGALRGLMDMRSVGLPKLAEEIGALAAALQDRLNAAHNDAAAVPPPARLTGRNTGLLATDALNFTGRAQIAVVSANGTLTLGGTIDFDAGTIALGTPPVTTGFGGTIGGLVAGLNTAFGGTLTASFTDGVLDLQAAGGAGVALTQDTAAPSNRGGRGFSHVFGLNDLVTGPMPSHFETGLAGTDAHGFTGAIDIVIRGSRGEILRQQTVTTAPGTMNALIAQLNGAAGGLGTFALDGNGRMTFTPPANDPGIRLEIGPDTTVRGTTGVQLAQMFGLGSRFRQEQAFGLQVRADIAANPARLATARLDLAQPVVVLGSTDARGIQAIASANATVFDIAAAGHLADTRTTLSSFAARIVGAAAERATGAEQQKAATGAVLEEVETRSAAVEGVNLDEELAAMMEFQQTYNAAARVLTTARELLDELMKLI